jgi:hypothetical protein
MDYDELKERLSNFSPWGEHEPDREQALYAIVQLQDDLAAARANADRASLAYRELWKSADKERDELLQDLAATRALLKKAQKYIYTDTILYDRIDAALGKDATC